LWLAALRAAPLRGMFPRGGFWLRLSAAGVPPLGYRASELRKWLMIRALQMSAFFGIFPLTIRAYMLIFFA